MWLHSLLVEALVVLPLVLDCNLVAQIHAGSHILCKQVETFQNDQYLKYCSSDGRKIVSYAVLLQLFWREILLVSVRLSSTVSSSWCNIPVHFVSSAAGHEDFCGHGLGHPPGASSPEGYNGEGPRPWRCHQAVQQVCQASLRAVHRAHHAPGRYRGATWCVKKKKNSDLSIYFFQITFYCLLLLLCCRISLYQCVCPPSRWRQHGGHWSDCAACPQSAGGGTDPFTCTHTHARTHVSNLVYRFILKTCLLSFCAPQRNCSTLPFIKLMITNSTAPSSVQTVQRLSGRINVH